MRTLIAFGVCCGVLVAALAWMIRPALVASDHADDSPALTVPAAPEREAAAPRSENARSLRESAEGQQASSKAPSENGPATNIERPDAAPLREPVAARSRSAVNFAGSRRDDELRRRLSTALDAIVRDPQNVVALDDALEAAASLNDEERVADLLGRKLRLAPDDQALRFRYATARMRLRQWVLALSELRALASAAPDDLRVWHNLALAQHALGSLTDAREAWGRVLKIAPSDTDARARRAELSLDLADWRGAAEDLEIVVAADMTATDAALNLALARLKLREYNAARAAVRPLLAIAGLKETAEKRLAAIDAAEFEAATPSRHEEPSPE